MSWKNKEDMPLVSIIMPVYNGQEYIEKSVDSVYRQNYHRIEFIIVNDGSTDASGEMLEQISGRVPENVSVRLIHQENRGICHARNRALEVATGRYIMFLDQDDYIRHDCVETLCGEIEKSQADIVIGGFDLVSHGGEILERWTLQPELPWSKFRITAPWGRIFRRELIDRYHIRFMITKISEDFYFNMLYMSYCGKIQVTPYRGYCWRMNEKSESHAGMSRLEKDRNPLVMLTALHREMDRPNILERDCVEYMVVKHIVWYLFFVVKGAQREDFQEMYRKCFAWLERYYPDYRREILYRAGFPKGEKMGTRCVVRAALLLKKWHLLPVALRIYALHK